MTSTICSLEFQIHFCYLCLLWTVGIYCCFDTFSNYQDWIVVCALLLDIYFSVVASCGGHSAKAFCVNYIHCSLYILDFICYPFRSTQMVKGNMFFLHTVCTDWTLSTSPSVLFCSTEFPGTQIPSIAAPNILRGFSFCWSKALTAFQSLGTDTFLKVLSYILANNYLG